VSLGPILERAERERVERNTREYERQAGGPLAPDKATAGVPTPQTHVYKPPAYLELPPSFNQAAQEAAKAGGLEAAANAATAPAGEASAEAGEAVKSGVEKGGAAVNKAIKSVTGWTSALGEILSKLLEGSFWLRILKFVLGGVLIIVAILLFARGAGAGVTTPVTGVTQAAGNIATGQAQRQRQRTSEVSPARRRAVAAGRAREAARDRQAAKPKPRAARTSSTKRATLELVR
jgi:hypothetical protein